MRRREFPKDVRRAAKERAGGHCEASGGLYGLNAGRRCYGDLSKGIEFDHVIADSIGGEPTLENCLAVCLFCHGWKTRNVDTPRAAKTKQMADKHSGVTRTKGTWGAGRKTPYKQKIGGRTVLRNP